MESNKRSFLTYKLLTSLSPEVLEALHSPRSYRSSPDEAEIGLREFIAALVTLHQKEFGEYLTLPNRQASLAENRISENSPDSGQVGMHNPQQRGLLLYPNCSEELLEILWEASRFAEPLRKKTSLKDVLVALANSERARDQLANLDLYFQSTLPPFEQFIDSVVYHHLFVLTNSEALTETIELEPLKGQFTVSIDNFLPDFRSGKTTVSLTINEEPILPPFEFASRKMLLQRRVNLSGSPELTIRLQGTVPSTISFAILRT